MEPFNLVDVKLILNLARTDEISRDDVTAPLLICLGLGLPVLHADGPYSGGMRLYSPYESNLASQNDSTSIKLPSGITL